MDKVLENLSPPSSIRSLNLASLPLMPVHSKSPTGETPSTATTRTLSGSSRTPAAAEAQRSKTALFAARNRKPSSNDVSPRWNPNARRLASSHLGSASQQKSSPPHPSGRRAYPLFLAGGGLIIKALHNLSHTQSGNIYHKNIENTSIFLYDVIHKSTQRA